MVSLYVDVLLPFRTGTGAMERMAAPFLPCIRLNPRYKESVALVLVDFLGCCIYIMYLVR